MATSPICSVCGAELPGNAPQGQCPNCLLRAAFPDCNPATEQPAPPPPQIIQANPDDGSSASLSRQTIGRYKLMEKIGEGAFGVVYVAEQKEPVRRRVALKVIKPGMDTREVVARFEAERQALAMMDHPNIARVFDAGMTESGRPYFVMELVRGTKITEYCDKNKLSTRQRLDLFVQVCHAVQHAHQKGIIHRDLKPSNILVTLHDGTPVPKVIDFGIAKATQGSLTDKTVYTQFQHFLGTPAYMSPEQAEMSGLDIDTRCDIYSLGVLLYELLTSQTPFDQKQLLAAGLDALRRAIREQEPPRPSTRLSTLEGSELTDAASRRGTDAPRLVNLLRGDLDWIVMKCLEKDRARRYETANGLAADIGRHLGNEPIMARPPSAAYRLQKMVRRNKVACIAAGVVFASLVAGLGISTDLFLKEKEAQKRADINATEEMVQRKRAEASKSDESIQRQHADAAADQVRMTLANADFERAMDLIEKDDQRDAAAYLARSVSMIPTNQADQERLTSNASDMSRVLTLFNLSSQNDQGAALAHLAKSLSLNPTNDTVSTRLTTLLASQTWWVPGTELEGITNVNSAQFSPEGKRIVTSSDDNTARVWDAQSGKPLTEPLKYYGTKAVSVRFSLDGRRIFTTSTDGTAWMWDARSGKVLSEHLNYGTNVDSTKFSPDGDRIVTTSKNGTARVWDVRSGSPMTEPLNFGTYLDSAEFSLDGKRILAASKDGTARVWDAQSGLPLTVPLNIGTNADSAQFSPDGKRILTKTEFSAQVWDAQTGQPVTGLLQDFSFVASAQFSPDGKRIVTAGGCHVSVWDAPTGQLLREGLQQAIGVGFAQLSPDRKQILVVSIDGTARVWHPVSGQQLTERLIPSTDVVSAQFSPDGSRIITVSDDGTARVWDSENGQLLAGPWKTKTKIDSAIFSPNGRLVLTTSSDGTARVWDAQNGQPLTEALNYDTDVVSAQFSPDGNRILTTSSDGTVRVWDARSGQPTKEPLNLDAFVDSAQFSPDGNRIFTTSRDGTARVWDARSGQPLTAPLNYGTNVDSAKFSQDGKLLLAISNDKAAQVWDVQSGRPLTSPIQHAIEIESAQFSPDGTRIVTLSTILTAFWLGSVQVWDSRTGQPVTEPLGLGNLATSVQFSPDGRRVVIASQESNARVWDVQSGRPLTGRLLHGGAVNSAQFSPDGRRIVTASNDGTARVWDIAPSTPPPTWLPRLAEAISGLVLNDQGVLVPTRLDRADFITKLRQELNQEPDANDWVHWGRWFLADPATRTISPFSKITVPEYIESRIKENTKDSLDEAEELASGNAKLRGRISSLQRALESKRRPAKHHQ